MYSFAFSLIFLFGLFSQSLHTHFHAGETATVFHKSTKAELTKTADCNLKLVAEQNVFDLLPTAFVAWLFSRPETQFSLHKRTEIIIVSQAAFLLRGPPVA